MPGALTREDEQSFVFEAVLAALPDGYFRGRFGDNGWGVTIRRSPDGRRTWLYAEELGGTDIVSFNLYRGAEGRMLLKPCEISSSKLIAFVLGLQV